MPARPAHLAPAAAARYENSTCNGKESPTGGAEVVSNLLTLQRVAGGTVRATQAVDASPGSRDLRIARLQQSNKGASL